MALAHPPKGYSSVREYFLKNPPPPPTTAEKIISGADRVLATLVILGMASLPFTIRFWVYGFEGIAIMLVGIALLVFLFYIVGHISLKR